MGRISITKEALIKKINEQLASYENPRFTVAILTSRINQIPNWQVSGHAVSGPSLLSADETGTLDKVLEQFVNYDVDWS